MTNFAFLIAAVLVGANAQAQAQYEQKLVLEKNEIVQIACPQGLSPILQGDVVQCGRTCKIEIVNISDYSNCDQGGCWNNPTTFKVTLDSGKNGSKDEPALFEGTFSITQKASVLEKVKADYSESCKLYQVSERNE